MRNGISSRQLVRRLFSSAELPRAPFIPWLFSHSASLEQIHVSLLAEAGPLAQALQNAQKLYGHDAIVSSFGAALEAEACGCLVTSGSHPTSLKILSHPLPERDPARWDASHPEQKGRLPASLEAVRRLKILVRDSAALVAVVTGPLTLANQLTGGEIIQELAESPEYAARLVKFAAQVCLQTCTAYCQLQPDVVAVVDEQLSSLPERHLPLVVSACKPVFGVVRFYNAYSLLVTRLHSGQSFQPLLSFPVDGLAVGGQFDISALCAAARHAGMVLGVGIPLSVLDGPAEAVHECVARLLEAGGKRKFFLTTEWEIPYDLPPEKMHALVRAIQCPHAGTTSEPFHTLR